ncbi:MAG: endonuclease/exonuclease/phosphatase family protein [Ignavibacteria bacterium]
MRKLLFVNFALFFVLITFTITSAQYEKFSNIKVMTFNIRYDNHDDGNNAWPKRKDKVVSMIKFYDVDLLGTQEVLKHQKDYLDKNLSDYKSFGVGRTDGKTKGEYSVIYYKYKKFELLDSGTFWLSETPDVVGSKGWDAAIERIATWVKLKSKSNDKELLFVNTHFDHRGELARINSAKLIINKIKEIAADLPVILCGDFNITKETGAYKSITENSAYKLYDANFITANPHHGPNFSFCGFDNDPKNKKKIDFIFVNNKINVIKHAVLSDKFDDGYPSDHFPVLSEVNFKD